MNVSVRHNSTNITSRTIQYSREHNICSGIGRLQLTIEGTYATTIDPHDNIDIYENGDFKVRYYVSQVSHSVPDGTIIVEAQDKSKYLVDYFIPDSYTVDYPSYTRYWIEKFLTEAQVSYSFVTSSQGNLLSNNTALGLQPAYDQLMMLLQLSGWYMYFDGNGIAVIGSLDTDLASSAGSVGLTDILDIKRITDDKMLRNRAVVWGQYDGINQEYAYADVTRHTRWNYDHNDLRTMVISNSNIPNKSSAYNIANILLKEFARVTIEKHITVHGARDYNLGEALRVNSHVWRGKGLITTFGVTMDRNGLVTNIILDERCPRLFGFFNFGDYVYVGTFGDGIWRKHIKFDPTWYNFSTGLLDLNITDLHINNGIFGAVGHSGHLYYANNEEGPWYNITISSLMSSQEDVVISGGTVAYVPFSGLMARAVIVDKELNTVKFGIDTWSGLNTGDYFLSSGIMTMASGELRGWIVEYDPYDGQPVGSIGSGIYPISYSGDYSVAVLDLENDGINDYVSIKTSGTGIPTDGVNWDFGTHITLPFASTKDYEEYAIAPSLTSYVDGSDSIQTNLAVKSRNALIAKDDSINGVQRVFAIGKDNKARLLSITKLPDNTLSTSVTTSASAGTGIDEIVAIWPEWYLGTFKIYYRSTASGVAHTYHYIIWNSNTDTWSASTLVGTESLLIPHPMDADSTQPSVVVNNKCYTLRYYLCAPTPVIGQYKSPIYLYVYIFTIDIELSTFTQTLLVELQTVDDDLDGNYEIIPGSSHTSTESLGTFNRTIFGLFQKNNGIEIIGWTETYKKDIPTRSREYVFKGNELGLPSELIYDSSSFRFGQNGTSNLWTQLTLDKGMIGRQSSTVGEGIFKYNGTVFLSETSSGSLPYYHDPSKIYPVLNNEDRYIALDSTTWVLCDALNMVTLANITPPINRTLIKPMSTAIKFVAEEIYFISFDNSLFEYNYIPYLPGDNSFNMPGLMKPDSVPSTTFRGFNFGGWFITEPVSYGVATPLASIIYIDMGVPSYGGATYLVLQREGSNFNLIQRANKPIRIDISNNSPVLTVQDDENTFQSNFVYGNSLTQVIPISGLEATEVRDFRYTLLEVASGVVVASGAGVGQQIVYVTGSGIYTSSAETYSGGFVLWNEIPSGYAERIETSNYTYPGQFIFVTTSGENPMFYQKDNDSLIFDTYSGLPDSRCTIIRCDDRY